MLRASTAALSKTVTALRLKEVKLFLNPSLVICSSPDAEQHHIINSSPDVKHIIICSKLHSAKNIIDCPATILSRPGLGRDVSYQDTELKSPELKTSSMSDANAAPCLDGEKIVSCSTVVEDKVFKMRARSPLIADERPEFVDTQGEATEDLAGQVLWRNLESSRAYLHGTAPGRGLFSI